MQPMGSPWRSLKFEIAFFALRTDGFWPLICASSFAAMSMFLMSVVASPTPMLMTIFTSRGACMTLV